MNILKINNWKQSIKETKQKRLSQDCKVFSLKFDKSKLSKEKQNYLKLLFVEAKWLHNHILSSKDLFAYDTKNIIVIAFDKDKNQIEHTLVALSSQMRQAVKQRLLYSIKGLSAKKKKGYKAGRLKFKSRVDSIVLNQSDITYKIIDKKHLKLQGCKHLFRIRGYDQIPKESEFANATLIRRNGNYYVKVTCFVPKENKVFPEKAVGLDFGIKTSVTLSNGEKYSISIPETNRLKRLQRRFRKKQKASNNWNHLKWLVRKEHKNITNKKSDFKNKFVSMLTNRFETICFQDENIKGWHSGWFGKQIQHSCLGGIIRDLKTKSHTPRQVDRFFPSTKLCPVCGRLNAIGLKERIYVCECGYQKDRDTHSANNILAEGLKTIPTGRRKSKPVENLISTPSSIIGANLGSMKQEALAFRQG